MRLAKQVHLGITCNSIATRLALWFCESSCVLWRGWPRGTLHSPSTPFPIQHCAGMPGQQKMIQVFGSQTHICETWLVFGAPDSGWQESQPVWPMKEQTNRWNIFFLIKLFLFLHYSAFQMNIFEKNVTSSKIGYTCSFFPPYGWYWVLSSEMR